MAEEDFNDDFNDDLTSAEIALLFPTPPLPGDRWVQRTAAEYAEAIAGELPTGAAWSRDPDSDLMRWVAGCAQIWGDVAAAAALLLLKESDPRYTVMLLPEWEDTFGLPDPCVPRVLTLPERQQALVNKMTTQGGQSQAFFIATAAALGYQIGIVEYRPFQFGLSSFGGSRGQLLGPTSRFYWTVTVFGPRLTRFQFGFSSFGRDSFLEIIKAQDLECVLNRWKPAHTVLLFDYLGTYASLATESGNEILTESGSGLFAQEGG